ncbi:PAS-domain containing protein [Shinella sp. CPCC 101442]|uniref:PAS domain-containing hybrid sensor histidine kinase/response regulator n=1 Tax=Shinella sp. CPCC 101442 TaxID=2932265 RepID=UPI00215271B8|nr:PAS-domain containing protein [Shinella sp. CPCC 101442]MCR6500348.1 PAS-domain containing protein [Shinella sp. CPCC 101442]
MTESQDELLVAAMARVRAHPYPAYVKSSELRYLAVNEPYAALFGHSPADMIGLRSDEIGELPGHGERDDPERRCLIFGNPERARFAHPFGRGSFDIALKRERVSPALSILVGLFTPSIEALASAVRAVANTDIKPTGTSAAGTPADEADPVESALDAFGAGIAIFGADNRLSYANRCMREFYRTLVGDLADGPISLASITEALHDMEVGRTTPAEREQWVAARLANYGLPLYETVARLAGGWMRLVTQRRPDGRLIAFRLDVTALKESEARLNQHSQEISLYRALLDELPVASFMRDESQRMIFANRAYVELTGKQPEELLGLTTLDMYPEQGEAFHAQNQFVLDTGELFETEIDYVRSDGFVLPTITRLYRVTTLDEKSYLIGSITDTMVLKKREGQLIEAQREAEAARADLASVVESLPVGIVVVDETGDIELINGAFETLWDDALPDLRGKPLGLLLRFQEAQGGTCEDGCATAPESHEQALHSIRSDTFAAREVAYANGRTLIEAGRSISGGRCLLTYIDITERREREREVLETRSALEEVGTLMEDAVSSMSQGLLIVEGEKVVLSNEALSTMIAMPPRLLQPGALVKDVLQSCIDRKIPGFVGEDPVDASRFGAILFTGKPASLTVLSGYERWLRLDVTPTSRGRSVIVFSDITDLKGREDELRRLVLRAETADKAKSEFLANMSHEIRTPMNGVLGMAELLAKSNLDTRQKTFIDIMVKSGNALLTIINDILDFSKIDAGQMTLRDTAFNPVEAIEDVATLLSAKAAEKDIELVVRGAAHMPAAVMGDAGRFRQIVTNLVGNAVKFTDRGHVLIDLASSPRPDGAVEIEIRVEDTGTGIPTEKMASIFEKFSQVDASSTRRHEGTGLGLAITDGLTRLFGGTLVADSAVGRGSVFTVRLPMMPAVAALPARIMPAKTSGARILVVDAHDLSRKASHDMLLGWGLDTTAVGSEGEALAVLTAAADMGVRVDAILLDYQPDRSPAFVRTLRDSAATAGSALIVLTSMNLPSEDKLLSSQDIQAHLMKPVRADLLRETVGEVLRATRAGRPMPAAVPTAEGKILALRPHAAGAAVAEGEVLDVLVAEDNEVNQILFTQMLMAAGLRFRLVGNGEEAVDVFRASRPGMILMDISMPVMNGLQASRAIRELESGTGHRVPIVAVTAHVLDGDREECLSAGMDDYLAKPISIEKLEEQIDRWLKRGKQHAANGMLR